MPKKRADALRRTQNLPHSQQVQPAAIPELDSNAESNDPAQISEPLPTPDSYAIASSSKVTLEIHTAYIHTQSYHAPRSPDNLVGSLDNLTLEDPQEDDIVLEDPPDDEEDPADNRNPLSLADAEGDEARGLPPKTSEESEDEEESNKETELPNQKQISQAEAKEMVTALHEIIQSSLHGHGRNRVSSLGDHVLTRLRFMAGTLNFIVERDLKLMDASLTAAVAYGRGKWAARQVRKWIRVFQKENMLPTSVYGTWNGSVMEDEDLSAAIQQWLRDSDRGKYVSARDVIDFFGTAAAEQFSNLIDAPPSIRTAQRWMQRMGYTWMKERRGQFADGHERDDVKDYRKNFYVPEWIKLERRMRSWDSEGNEIPPNTCRRRTNSRDYGWLRSSPAFASATPNASAESPAGGKTSDHARAIFRAGTQRDGWFGTVHVVEQLSRAMSIVKKQYPNEEHVFIFDNATIHTKLPGNTPNVPKMTLNPSQKVKGDEIGPSGEKMKVEYAPAILPDGSIQQFYHPKDHPNVDLKGAFKGLTLILKERGVPNARKLKLVCPSTNSFKQGCPPGSTNCCARRTMMNQPDILAQKSILQLQAAAEGFSVLYLPKYHCELNPIEQCWGAAKRVYRDSPTSSSEADLKQNMLRALESVTLKSIRRFAARSQRFVHHYGRGLSGDEAAWATKQFRGHRIIPETLLQAMDNEG
ncbi:DDE family endonuclease, partial [Rhizoctonia solani AG-3 Rhs1AP]